MADSAAEFTEQEPTGQELLEAANTFSKYVGMTEAERAAVINTGMFNSFIEAYTILTLREIGAATQEQEQRARAAIKEILDNTSAAEAIAEANAI